MERDSPTAGFLRGFEVGRRAKLDRDEFEEGKQTRDLARKKMKLDMDRLKIQDIEAARESAFKEAEHYRSLNEPPDTAETTQMPWQMGSRTDVTPGQHPEINIPAGAYGQPASKIQPMGMRGLMAAQELQKRTERKRTVTPELAGATGLPAGEYDQDVLGPAVTAVDASKNRASIEREGAASRRTQERVANIYANANRPGGAGGTTAEEDAADPQVMSYVKLLNSGEATLSQVPSGKQGRFMRDRVVKVLTGMDLAIMSPKMQEKLGQFIPAQAAVDELESSLNRVENADSASERAMGTMQLVNEVKALSRLVGRSVGEKGVFTDQDKEDFASLLQPGGGGVVTGLAANLAPKFSRDRLNGARALMDRVKQREFGAIEQRTGGRTVPGMSGHTPPGAGGGAEADFIMDASGNIVPNPRKR